MNIRFSLRFLATALILCASSIRLAAADHFVSPVGLHVSPFTDWNSAATNIQDAIDAAADGDTIWVTNGVYAAGGKVMSGDLTNRIALDKPLTVRSVNGPWRTVILGTGATNGNAAVRCAWLTNGAVLHGFTLQGGATRISGSLDLRNGGGVWCSSSNATVMNSVIASNTAAFLGGGAYSGTLRNCLVRNNATQPSTVGAVGDAILINCTVVSNASSGISLSAPFNSRVTNSIVYFNGNMNFNGFALVDHSCTTPLPTGLGNISAAPDFASDGIHLSNPSPCRGSGLDVASGTDIFGQPWASPPSMGCAEWQPLPSVPDPVVKLSSNPPGFVVSVSGTTGEEPITYRWLRDGVVIEGDTHFLGANSATLTANGIQANDFGHYQLIASNLWGAVTSEVAQVTFRFVNVNNPSPTPPFTSWASAATNIQDAIDAALPGEVVMVTNGVYASGGKIMSGNLTNRIAIDKAVVVQSVNGPGVTTILGSPEPTLTTNGLTAVRCAWITNGAALNGFTLIGGGTRIGTSSFDVPVATGGGVYGVSTNATVADCIIATNTASYAGGGAYQVRLLDCLVIGNRLGNWDDFSSYGGSGGGGGAAACDLIGCVVSHNRSERRDGGGTFNCHLRNCAVIENYSPSRGGGVQSGTLINCTVSGNVCSGLTSPSAVNGASATNCVIWGNVLLGPLSSANYADSTLAYCCSDPLPPGIGNISSDPKLLIDGIHLAPDSPCIGMGTASVVSGKDIDNQSWAASPAMGCDEWKMEPLVVVQPTIQFLWSTPARLKIGGAAVAGQEPIALWWTKDGNIIEESSHFESAHSTDLILNAFGPADSGVYQLIASNSFGIATSSVVTVTVHCVDAAGADPIAPFSTWATAATNIQEAIDAAAAGEFVLVTNGVYAHGGKIIAGDLMNRVVLDKPLTVASVNGYQETIIRGAWDPNTTNGTLAVRGACLMRNSTLIGFTVEGGATRADGDIFTGQYGGGIWCEPNFAEYVINCNIRSNSAAYGGGGIYCGYVSNSVILANSAQYGGGSYGSLLANSLIQSNSASVYGGGAQPFRMVNCTVVGNYAPRGGGLYLGGSPNQVINSIVYNNDSALPLQNDRNYYFIFSPPFSPAIVESCTTPLPSGSGNNIDADPQFVDGFHIAITSPCLAAGVSNAATGIDLDGEPWANPPSMGCDEPVESAITGPLEVGISTLFENVVAGKFFGLSGAIVGRASRLAWEFGDGSNLTNGSFLNVGHIWTNAGDFPVRFTAYNADFPNGVSTNLDIHVVPLITPSLSLEISGTNLSFLFPAQPGLLYWLEQTASLTPPNWQTVTGAYATNSTMKLILPNTVDPMRFYRIRIQ
ncbi:MAG TPA: PKD domain-containing protein [Verrucomicrobiae bacterium]|nr:PKD domain-containing protein [Verrucomicrobiae bacterium]